MNMLSRVDCLVHQSAGIAAQVEHEGAGSLFFQFDEGPAHVTRTSVEETAEHDVAYMVLQHAVVGDGRCLHILACHFDGLWFGQSGTFVFQHEAGARFAAQAVAHLLGGHSGEVFPVDFQEDVARLQAGFCAAMPS